MSDDDFENDDESQDEPLVHLKRSQIKGIEQKAKQAEEFETRAEKAERRLAFAEAGIDLKDPKLAYFIKGYDGDADSESIRSAAAEAGFIEPPNGSGNAEELAAQQRIANAGSEAIAPADNIPLADALNAAQNEEELMAVVRASQELRAPEQP